MDNTREYINFHVSAFCKFIEYVSLRLFATGGGNWDYYANEKGTLYYIAKFGSGAASGYFGDCNHVRHLIYKGHFNPAQLTAYGRQLMTEKAGFSGN